MLSLITIFGSYHCVVYTFNFQILNGDNLDARSSTAFICQAPSDDQTFTILPTSLTIFFVILFFLVWYYSNK